MTPTYHQIHNVLSNPVFAGAYAFGKTRRERYVDQQGRPRKRTRKLSREEWEVLIWDHHSGFINKPTFELNQAQLASNTRPRAPEPGGAVREGQALLQGIAVCGRCGRKLMVHYQGRRGHKSPAYHCPSSDLVENRGSWCMRIGGGRIEQVVVGALLAALTPAGVKAALRAAEMLEAATTRLLRSGGFRSSARAIRQSGPSAATARSSPSTAWSRAASSATGKRRLVSWLRPRPSLPCASASARARSLPKSASSSSRWALISGGCGRRPPPPTAIASNSCAVSSKK